MTYIPLSTLAWYDTKVDTLNEEFVNKLGAERMDTKLITEQYVKDAIPPIKPVVKGKPYYNWMKNYWKYKTGSLAWDVAIQEIAKLMETNEIEVRALFNLKKRIPSQQTN